MNIAIADDSQEMLEIIKQTILIECAELQFSLIEYRRPMQLLYDIQEKKQYDIYLLDIEMPEINGLDLAKQVRAYQESACIIFLTSHAEFALEGYDLSIKASGYILKDRLREMLPNVLKSVYQQLDASIKKSYTIDTQVRFERIFYRDILYVYKEQRNIVIVTEKGIHKERTTLEKFKKKFPVNELIVIDRGMIVNILHIQKIVRNEVHMENGKMLEISRANIAKVKEQVSQYWRVNL